MNLELTLFHKPINKNFMYLTDEEVLQFQTIYYKNFGKEISKEDALERGIKLARLFEIIYKPMTKQELKLTEARIKEVQNEK